MTFGEKLKYAAFGCFCTLVGVLFTSFVLTLFADPDEHFFQEHIVCKRLSVINDNGNIIASLDRGVFDDNYGQLTLHHSDKTDMVIITSSALSFSIDDKPVIVLESFIDSGKLSLRSNINDGMAVIGEQQGEFALRIFGSEGVEVGAGVSLSIQENKGQITLFGENTEILFGRGEFIYGE